MSKPEDIITQTGFYCAPIHGMSMYPLLKNHRDSVCIKPCDKPKKYDVVLFRRQSGQLVLHRILKTDGDCFLICGDNEFVKEKVYQKQIIGKMTEYYRKDKKHNTNSFNFFIYSRLWCSSFFVKRILLRIYSHFDKD